MKTSTQENYGTKKKWKLMQAVFCAKPGYIGTTLLSTLHKQYYNNSTFSQMQDKTADQNGILSAPNSQIMTLNQFIPNCLLSDDG